MIAMKVFSHTKRIIAIVLALAMTVMQGQYVPLIYAEGNVPLEDLVPVAALEEQTDNPGETDGEPDTLGVPYAPPKTDEGEEAADPENTELQGDSVVLPDPGQTGEEPVLRGAKSNPAAIPVVAGPNVAGTMLEFGEDNVSFEISIPAAGPYVLHLDKDTGSSYYAYCRILDTDGKYMSNAYANVYEQYGDSWDIYFTAEEAGTYTASFTGIGYNGTYDDDTGTSIPYAGEKAFTLTAKAYATVAEPEFALGSAVDEYGAFTAPFALHFTVPEGCTVWYCIFPDGRWEDEPEFVQYDPSNPVTINQVCDVQAYAKKVTADGTLISETVSMSFSVAGTEISCESSIVESGGTITLEIENPNLTVYYLVGTQGMERPSAQDLIDNNLVYHGSITITGENGSYVPVYYVGVLPNGLVGRVSGTWIEIGTPPPDIPTFSPNDMGNGLYTPVEWNAPQQVTITSAQGTVLYYVLNKSLGDYLEKDYDGVLTNGTNTLTLTVDRDLYVEVRAYDPQTDLYSEARTNGYSVLGNSTRGYVIAQPKTLTLSQSAVIHSDGMIFQNHDETYTLSVQEAGTYRFTVSMPNKYYYDNMPVTVYDAGGNVVATVDTDYEYEGALDATLSRGTYTLELAAAEDGYHAADGYELTVTKGVNPPTFYVDGVAVEPDTTGYYDGPVALTLVPDDPADTVWWSYYSWGGFVEYTGPMNITGDSRIYAYTQSGDVYSDTVSHYFDISLAKPAFSVQSGTYNQSFSLVLSHDNPDAEIWYSLNYGEYVR